MPAEHRFVAKDSASEPHEYDCTRHRGSEGMPLTMRIGSLIVEPLAAGLGPVVLASLEAGATGGKASGEGLRGLINDPNVLASLDLQALARGVRGALGGLSSETIYQILAYTNRDGQPLTVKGRPGSTFDRAYAGNYGELMRVLWEVCRYNGFFPALATFAAAGKKVRAPAPGHPKSET